MLMDYSWSTTIPNWSKGNNRTKDSATSLTNWKSDQMKLTQSSELRVSSDLISAEFQQNLSSTYKAAVIADATMIGLREIHSFKIYGSWVVKDTQWCALKNSCIWALLSWPLIGSQLIFRRAKDWEQGNICIFEDRSQKNPGLPWGKWQSSPSKTVCGFWVTALFQIQAGFECSLFSKKRLRYTEKVMALVRGRCVWHILWGYREH